MHCTPSPGLKFPPCSLCKQFRQSMQSVSEVRFPKEIYGNSLSQKLNTSTLFTFEKKRKRKKKSTLLTKNNKTVSISVIIVHPRCQTLQQSRQGLRRQRAKCIYTRWQVLKCVHSELQPVHTYVTGFIAPKSMCPLITELHSVTIYRTVWMFDRVGVCVHRDTAKAWIYTFYLSHFLSPKDCANVQTEVHNRWIHMQHTPLSRRVCGGNNYNPWVSTMLVDLYM